MSPSKSTMKSSRGTWWHKGLKPLRWTGLHNWDRRVHQKTLRHWTWSWLGLPASRTVDSTFSKPLSQWRLVGVIFGRLIEVLLIFWAWQIKILLQIHQPWEQQNKITKIPLKAIPAKVSGRSLSLARLGDWSYDEARSSIIPTRLMETDLKRHRLVLGHTPH